jgi:hypothetical protein
VRDSFAEFQHEPAAIRTTVVRAVWETASGKSTESNEVPAELFKQIEESIIDTKHPIFEMLQETV